MVEKVFSDASLVFEVERRDGRAAENHIVIRKIAVFDFCGGKIFKNVDFYVTKMRFEVFFGGLTFFTIAEK